jgi:lysozyme family protein
MALNGVDRRTLVKLLASVPASALLGERARAQTSDTIDIFGVPVPTGLARKVLPGRTFDKARTIAAIMALERKTHQLRLPFSPLEAIKPPPLVSDEDSFYQSAVQRLVTIIDRAEASDPATADEAGAILADVNAQEREVPEALKPAPGPMSTARNFPALRDEYRRLFSTMALRSESSDTIAFHARQATGSRARYEGVSRDTGVPWYFIAAIHTLEASSNFRAHLHNGDFPLTSRTRQVPAGRPLVWLPPSDWASSAHNALRLLGFTGQSDWSLERTLYRLEAYNGFGYRGRRVPTPYLWSQSNHYERGKFVADGRWSATARSQQVGAAVLIKALADEGVVSIG